MARKTALKKEKRLESLLLSNYESDFFTTRTDAIVPLSEQGRDDPEGLSYGQGEREDAQPSALSVEEANSESEGSSSVPFEDAHVEFSFLSPTLGPERRPAWVNAPVQPNPPYPNTADPRRLVYRSKIPIHPLHKQAFYRRILFFLRGWLSRRFRKTL